MDVDGEIREWKLKVVQKKSNLNESTFSQKGYWSTRTKDSYFVTYDLCQRASGEMWGAAQTRCRCVVCMCRWPTVGQSCSFGACCTSELCGVLLFSAGVPFMWLRREKQNHEALLELQSFPTRFTVTSPCVMAGACSEAAILVLQMVLWTQTNRRDTRQTLFLENNVANFTRTLFTELRICCDHDNQCIYAGSSKKKAMFV